MNLNINTNYVESLVLQTKRLSGTTPEGLSCLHSLLKQSEDTLRTESARFASSLADLDPFKHSLGYLYILEVCTAGTISKELANELVLSNARFISECDAEQIRLDPEKFISLCKRFKDQVM